MVMMMIFVSYHCDYEELILSIMFIIVVMMLFRVTAAMEESSSESNFATALTDYLYNTNIASCAFFLLLSFVIC